MLAAGCSDSDGDREVAPAPDGDREVARAQEPDLSLEGGGYAVPAGANGIVLGAYTGDALLADAVVAVRDAEGRTFLATTRPPGRFWLADSEIDDDVTAHFDDLWDDGAVARRVDDERAVVVWGDAGTKDDRIAVARSLEAPDGVPRAASDDVEVVGRLDAGWPARAAYVEHEGVIVVTVTVERTEQQALRALMDSGMAERLRSTAATFGGYPRAPLATDIEVAGGDATVGTVTYHHYGLVVPGDVGLALMVSLQVRDAPADPRTLAALAETIEVVDEAELEARTRAVIEERAGIDPATALWSGAVHGDHRHIIGTGDRLCTVDVDISPFAARVARSCVERRPGHLTASAVGTLGVGAARPAFHDVWGTASRDVARVVVVLDDGEIEAALHRTEGEPGQVFVAELGEARPIRAVVAHDAAGAEIDRITSATGELPGFSLNGWAPLT